MHPSTHPRAGAGALEIRPRLAWVLALALLLVLAAPACLPGQAAAASRVSGALAAHREAVRAPLLVPVAGVRPAELRDGFRSPRSGGREHMAIDIPAPRGTPVLAAADGTVLRLHAGSRGGNALYQLDADGLTRYYYAHLDRYAEGIREGKAVRRGEVVGYVGDTGNAAPGDFHLHFSVAVLRDARRWWEGINLNPYPLLRRPGAERQSTPHPDSLP